MIDTVFRSLLSCEDCGHSVESHAGNGCRMVGCACPATREAVIETNIVLAKNEYRWARDGQ